MGHVQKTDPRLPHPKATGLTTAICGFATLGLVGVLGFSFASNATNAPGDGDKPVTIVTRPPATDMAVIASAAPFDVAGCTAMAAAHR
ncbi:hypothetical protein KXR53_23390 [Inquilinus limosus]|uniref:hypothetical protein n=1 Tax=Inquilinus limosus TaxID=171674 RepID=UPI003F14054D